MRIVALMPALLLAAPAWAGSVTVVNNGGETIRRIEISMSGATSENRLRSTLPTGATAHIGFSAGCQVVVRLGYESGRTEEFGGIDACNGGRVVSGGGVAGAPNFDMARPATTPVAAQVAGAKPRSASSTTPVLAPPPEVPPWTGKSITKRFGGMD